MQPQSSPRMFSPPRTFSRASACDHRLVLLSIDSPLLGIILNVHLGGTAQLRVGSQETVAPGRSCAGLACPSLAPRVLRSAVCRGGSHALGLPCPPAVHPVLRLPSLLDAPGIGDEAVPLVISRLALLSGRRSFWSILEPHCAPYSSAQVASERLGRVFCSSPQRWQGSA